MRLQQRSPLPLASKMASRLRLAHLLLRWMRPPTCLSNHPIFHPISSPWQCGMRYAVAHCYTHRAVSLVIRDGQPKFEMHQFQEPKKSKWMSKKRLKKKRMRAKTKRKEANKRDPRRLRPKKGNPRFATAEERLEYKIHKAKIKEALLVERLKAYEVLKIQGPMVKPETLTGEERFYMKKMAQKRSNYVPIGRRGVFGGVILNMHLHWKKHETVKVICKPCKPGQVHEYGREIARLSGGIPIQVIGDDTIIFYRGRNYVRPEVMSPIDTLSKKKALEKSKYEQSLETVRHFIAIAERELQLYYQHIALYDNPSTRFTDNPAPFMNTNFSEDKSKVLREGEDGAYGVTTTGTHLNNKVGLIDGNAGDVEHNDHHNDAVQSNHEAPLEFSIYTDAEENGENIYSDIEASEDNNYSSTEEYEESTIFDTDSGTEECEDDNIQ